MAKNSEDTGSHAGLAMDGLHLYSTPTTDWPPLYLEDKGPEGN